MARKLPKYKPPHLPAFKKVVRTVIETANEVLDEEVERFANTERADFVRNIKQQTFQSFIEHPLSDNYAARKRQAGLDRRVMIATGWYTQHIRVWRNRDPRGNPRVRYYRVGFHPQVRARDSKGRIVPITLNRLAFVHEKGSIKRSIPARPHWQPHLNAMRGRAPAVRSGIRKKIVKKVRERLKGVF